MISKNRLLGCSCLWISSNLYFACACIHMYIYTQQLHTCYPAQRQALAAQQKTCTNYQARTFPFNMPTYKHLLPICFNSHSSVLATYSVSIYTDVDIQNKHTICVRALQPLQSHVMPLTPRKDARTQYTHMYMYIYVHTYILTHLCATLSPLGISAPCFTSVN